MYYLYGKRVDTMSRGELLGWVITLGNNSNYIGLHKTDRWKRYIQERMSKCGGSHVGRAMVRSMAR